MQDVTKSPIRSPQLQGKQPLTGTYSEKADIYDLGIERQAGEILKISNVLP